MALGMPPSAEHPMADPDYAENIDETIDLIRDGEADAEGVDRGGTDVYLLDVMVVVWPAQEQPLLERWPSPAAARARFVRLAVPAR